MQTKNHGFTLLELMSVVAIIGVLAAVAIPNYSGYLKRAKISEAFILASGLTNTIVDYYSYYGRLPKNNEAADLPEPENLGGQYIESMQIENGAIHVTFKNSADYVNSSEEVKEEYRATLTLRPAIVAAYPASNALTWICGYATAVTGMTIIGNNKTDIAAEYLPLNCR